VNGLVGTLGVEWARYGVRINAVAPGYVETDMVMQGVRDGIINLEELLTVFPIKRMMKPEEIAAAVSFLASDAASGVVGQTLFVDGGWSKNGLRKKKSSNLASAKRKDGMLYAIAAYGLWASSPCSGSSWPACPPSRPSPTGSCGPPRSRRSC
jgi:hypothetical protein